MNEEEWLQSTNPQAMLLWLGERISDRKARLVSAAWGRLVWDRMHEKARRILVLMEKYADGQVTIDAITNVYESDPYPSVVDVEQLSNSVTWAIRCLKWAGEVFRIKNAEVVQTPILRHIVGNPFRPYAAPPSWPSQVVQLAASMYEGASCSFALHDALLEAGHSELAEHFKAEEWHPKGCWVLDVILGKK